MIELRTAGRALVVWLVMMSLEFLQGLLRTWLLAPRIGDFRARQVGVFTGSVLIVGVAWLFIRWLRDGDTGSLRVVGLAWLTLTVSFELLFGRLVVGASWETLAADYEIWRGGLLPVGLAVLTFSPWIASRLRGPD